MYYDFYMLKNPKMEEKMTINFKWKKQMILSVFMIVKTYLTR